MEVSFNVPAIPIAQPRQRHAMIGGHMRNYTPSKHPVNDFKATVRLAAQQAYQGAPLEGPLGLSVLFVMPRPKGKTKKRGDNPRYPHTSRPDFDNLAKGLCDSLKGLAWHDDAQIAETHLTKVVAAADEQPHVCVTIRQL